MVYGFNHDEAVRSFRRAAELDPASPMPHWGIALALGPNINTRRRRRSREGRVRRSAAGARRSRLGAPASERAYVEALVERYSNDPKADLKALAVRYKDAMRELTRRYPDDLDAATLYAESLMDLHPWQLWSADGKPTEGTEEIVAHARGSAAPRSDAHRREPLLHPRRRGVAGRPDRALASAQPARDAGSGRRPSRPHAGAHLHAHRRLRRCRRQQREGRRGRSRVHQGARRQRPLPDDVLQPQPRLPRIGGHDVGTVQRGEERRRHGRLQRDADDSRRWPMLEPFAAKTLYVLLRFRQMGRRDGAAAAGSGAPAAHGAVALRPRCGAGGAWQ